MCSVVYEGFVGLGAWRTIGQWLIMISGILVGVFVYTGVLLAIDGQARSLLSQYLTLATKSHRYD